MSKVDEKEIRVAKAEDSEAEAKIEKSSQGERKKDSNKTMMIIMGAVIAVMAGAIVVLSMRKPAEEPQEEPRRNVVVTQENAEAVAEEMVNREYVAPGYYATKMSTTWHFSSGDAVSEDAYVENDIDNTNDVYFDVFLSSDESTPILESPVIPIGSKMENIALDTVLGAGTYDCVMVYHLVDENQNTISTLRVGFTIIVEN